MSKTITLDHITKIEGHAHLEVKVENGKVTRCSLGSTEGARFFEGLVVGRPYDDGVEMTMRICGICSVGHFTASLKALEDAMGVVVTEQTQAMREIMAIGERIRSHATHLYFLSLPDFLGYESALAMAPEHKKEIEDALALMRLGNEIVIIFGGRQMHPMGGVVGGFTHFPSKEQVQHLISLLDAAEEPALRTLKLFLKLPTQKLRTTRNTSRSIKSTASRSSRASSSRTRVGGRARTITASGSASISTGTAPPSSSSGKRRASCSARSRASTTTSRRWIGT